MNKRILVIGLALALGGISTASFAAEPGNFYVGAGVGQAKWHVSGDTGGVKFDDTHTTTNVRFGYVWHSRVDFAVEGGYVDLGKISTSYVDQYDNEHGSAKVSGLFAGVKAKSHFGGNWYVDARGGLFVGRLKSHDTDTYKNGNSMATDTYSSSETKTGEYLGVGIGYDFTRHFGMGLNYTYYHNKFDDQKVNFDAATVSAEYRF